MSLKQRYDSDPFLEEISRFIPDGAIDTLFPRGFSKQRGPQNIFKTSQLFRVHLLTMLKQIPSFNKLCRELKIQRSWRDFCGLKNKYKVPNVWILSQFRRKFGDSGLIRINELLFLILSKVLKFPRLLIAVPDSTGLEAACYGFRKKNANVPAPVNAPKNSPLKEPNGEPVRKNPGNPSTLWDIKSILSGSFLRNPTAGIASR